MARRCGTLSTPGAATDTDRRSIEPEGRHVRGPAPPQESALLNVAGTPLAVVRAWLASLSSRPGAVAVRIYLASRKLPSLCAGRASLGTTGSGQLDSISSTAFAEEAQRWGTTRLQRLSSAHVLNGQEVVEQRARLFPCGGTVGAGSAAAFARTFLQEIGLGCFLRSPRGSAGHLARGGSLAALNTFEASGRPRLPFRHSPLRQASNARKLRLRRHCP